ncbi:hypothetical protein BH10PLA2_BH10PLA2_16000 [soil metagenome]
MGAEQEDALRVSPAGDRPGRADSLPSAGTAEAGRAAGSRKWKARKILWTVWGGAVVAAFYYANHYRLEQNWLKKRAEEIVHAAGVSGSEQETMALRDYVRTHVRYEGVDQESRPFFRSSARETLESGQGYCGEATRAFICLAGQRGIKAQRVNLYGRTNHVVAEVLTRPNREVLVDVQDNPDTNPYLDKAKLTVHQVANDPLSPFTEYSNIHLRRLPFIGPYIQHIKLEQSWFTWVLENPSLLKSILWGGIAFAAALVFVVDRLLVRFYAFRFGLKHSRKAV